MMPKRIQRQRTKGWRMPEGAWGVYGPGVFVKTRDQTSAQELAVALYRSWLCTRTLRVHKPERDRILTELPKLHGSDLACWCPSEFACHADVLLELANQEVTA